MLAAAPGYAAYCPRGLLPAAAAETCFEESALFAVRPLAKLTPDWAERPLTWLPAREPGADPTSLLDCPAAAWRLPVSESPPRDCLREMHCFSRL